MKGFQPKTEEQKQKEAEAKEQGKKWMKETNDNMAGHLLKGLQLDVQNYLQDHQEMLPAAEWFDARYMDEGQHKDCPELEELKSSELPDQKKATCLLWSVLHKAESSESTKEDMTAKE